MIIFINKNNINGIIFIDKPKGITSNKCLMNIKHKFNIKKIGYIGTLDPIATGILPICIGQATKFSKFLSNSDKYYLVEAKLGISTDTYDITGKIKIIYDKTKKITLFKIHKILNLYKGINYQKPPIFSAIKIKGIPSYKYARNNINVKLKYRIIYIYNIDIISYNKNILKLLIHCSKGTYIRSLIHDLGKKLNSGAYVVNLRRIQISNYLNIYKLLILNNNKIKKISNIYILNKFIYPIDILLFNLQTINLIKKIDIIKFINGNIINTVNIFNNIYIKVTATYKKIFIGVGKIDNKGNILPFRLLSNLINNYEILHS